ncbi:hypothetical protein TNCT_345231 [Trichonephila clavata]|uniref:Uncharacterized protein n=1 Tax=Trichonephila clavata TaxID=2740835 RepID=A0A8X6F9S0_TRICU|nr:hypothetical protein TNCT_345231 [Trichonephila clavata]
MAARNDQSEPAKNSNSKPQSNKNEGNSSPSGFISAMAEFRKFFQDYPGLLEAGRAFKNASNDEEKLDIFFGVLASKGKSSPPPS